MRICRFARERLREPVQHTFPLQSPGDGATQPLAHPLRCAFLYWEICGVDYV